MDVNHFRLYSIVYNDDLLKSRLERLFRDFFFLSKWLDKEYFDDDLEYLKEDKRLKIRN